MLLCCHGAVTHRLRTPRLQQLAARPATEAEQRAGRQPNARKPAASLDELIGFVSSAKLAAHHFQAQRCTLSAVGWHDSEVEDERICALSSDVVPSTSLTASHGPAQVLDAGAEPRRGRVPAALRGGGGAHAGAGRRRSAAAVPPRPRRAGLLRLVRCPSHWPCCVRPKGDVMLPLPSTMSVP